MTKPNRENRSHFNQNNLPTKLELYSQALEMAEKTVYENSVVIETKKLFKPIGQFVITSVTIPLDKKGVCELQCLHSFVPFTIEINIQNHSFDPTNLIDRGLNENVDIAQAITETIDIIKYWQTKLIEFIHTD